MPGSSRSGRCGGGPGRWPAAGSAAGVPAADAPPAGALRAWLEAARSAAAVMAASLASSRCRSSPSTRADSSATVVFLSCASWSTRTVRCACASATACDLGGVGLFGLGLAGLGCSGGVVGSRLASSAAAVRDCAAVAAVSADSKARLRLAERAWSVAACCSASPLPLTKVVSVGLRPPLRYRSPASWPTCLRVLSCASVAAFALAVAASAAPTALQLHQGLAVGVVCLHGQGESSLLGGCGVRQEPFDGGDLIRRRAFTGFCRRNVFRGGNLRRSRTLDGGQSRAGVGRCLGREVRGVRTVRRRCTARRPSGRIRTNPFAEPRSSQAGERGLVAARKAPLLIAQQSEAT